MEKKLLFGPASCRASSHCRLSKGCAKTPLAASGRSEGVYAWVVFEEVPPCLSCLRQQQQENRTKTTPFLGVPKMTHTQLCHTHLKHAGLTLLTPHLRWEVFEGCSLVSEYPGLKPPLKEWPWDPIWMMKFLRYIGAYMNPRCFSGGLQRREYTVFSLRNQC